MSENCNCPKCTAAAQVRTKDLTCDCMFFPNNLSYAMAYIPFQTLDMVYECDKGLQIGTIFPELNKPWMVPTKGCMR